MGIHLLQPLFMLRGKMVAAALICLTTAAFGQDYYSYGGTIPNNGTQACFSQTVAGVGALTGANKIVRVCLSITQDRAADMDIFLISPSGTSVELSTDNGGTSGNDYHTGICFSECAPSGPIAGMNDFRGVYLPEGNLANFNNGQSADGNWRLCITDDNGTGTSSILNYWSIDFGTTVAPTTPTGETCASAFNLTSLPFDHTCMTLAGHVDDYTACGSNMDGAEYVYTYTPQNPDEFLSIDIAQDFSTPSGFPTVSLLDVCPDVALAANCIQTEIQFSSTENILHITSVPLVQGTTYYIVVASSSGVGGVNDIRIRSSENGNDDCLQATVIDSEGEYSGNNYTATIPSTQSPSTLEMTCNGAIDNFIFYTFTTDAVGGTVHAHITDIDCDLSCGGACGIQVALFQAPAGGACLGGGTWGAPVACEASTLANSYYTWTGLLPNTQYYLMVDGNAGSPCVWNLRLEGGFQNVVLPVDITEIRAEHLSRNNLVTWTSEREEGLSHFVVEHATVIPFFEEAGRVEAQAQEGGGKTYHFPDNHLAPGHHYFRIKSVDENGAERYSSIASLEISDLVESLELYPNPASDVLHVKVNAQGEWSARILSIAGSEQAAFTRNGGVNDGAIAWDISSLPAGVYVVELTGAGNARYHYRLVKQ